MKVVPSDLEIAQAHKMTPITEIAAKIGLGEDDIDLYGKYKARLIWMSCANLKTIPWAS
ncbi:hypothetical protein N752_16455 [Desulforamulus aquiferis]|nr:hypothetical protein N752_16455 [Desulforamulus aquiferis]